jgi:uncharacterized Zn ribbon protein
MKNYAAIGACPVCGQGRLIVARDHSSQSLYVLCEECESEWESPEESKTAEAATHDVHGQSTLLDRLDLEEHPWRKWLW